MVIPSISAMYGTRHVLVKWLSYKWNRKYFKFHFISGFISLTKMCTILCLIFLCEEVPLRRAAFGICDGPDIAACAERLFPSPLDNYHLNLVLPLLQLGMYLSGNKGMQGITLWS